MNPSSIVTQMFSQILSAYWWMIPLLLFIAFLRTPFMKGVLGEFLVYTAAKLFL